MTSRNFILQVCSNVMRRLPATACVDRHQAQPQPEDFALTRTKAINLYRGEFPTVSREAAGVRIDRARKAGHILSTGTGKARRLDLTSFYAWLYGECHDPKREADMQTIPPGKPPDRM